MKTAWLAAGSITLLPSCSLLITPLEPEPHQPIKWRRSSEVTPVLAFSHGYHTSLTLPAESLRTFLPELCEGLTDEWLEFGWGDEGFYRSETVTAQLVFNALCYPTPGVVHVVVVEPPIPQHYHYSPIRLLEINQAKTANLGAFLADSFQRTEKNKLIPLGAGRYGRSTFYRAVESYYFPRSCNDWTARGLQAGGINMSKTLTAPGLLRQLPE